MTRGSGWPEMLAQVMPDHRQGVASASFQLEKAAAADASTADFRVRSAMPSEERERTGRKKKRRKMKSVTVI